MIRLAGLAFLLLWVGVTPCPAAPAVPASASIGGREFKAPASAISGREFKECPECPQMIAIPAGRFVMGSPASEPGRFDNEGPQHVVNVKAFALAKTPVTSAAFVDFLRATGYRPQPCNEILGLQWHQLGHGIVYAPLGPEPPDWPAVCLDEKDAQAYIAWINKRVRAARPALAARKSGPYRLPSEAEWEYAARAGTTTARWWGDAIGVNKANCNGCGSRWDNRLLAPVGSFPANPFGLDGMLGNIWEWTEDCWHPSYVGAPADGSAWVEPDCTRHVIRGGSWNNVPVFIRSAARVGAGNDGPVRRFDYSTLTGFRLARDLP
jgi:formylglycine-generating enzyme required for sulfatase activity